MVFIWREYYKMAKGKESAWSCNTCGSKETIMFNGQCCSCYEKKNKLDKK